MAEQDDKQDDRLNVILEDLDTLMNEHPESTIVVNRIRRFIVDMIVDVARKSGRVTDAEADYLKRAAKREEEDLGDRPEEGNAQHEAWILDELYLLEGQSTRRMFFCFPIHIF